MQKLTQGQKSILKEIEYLGHEIKTLQELNTSLLLEIKAKGYGIRAGSVHIDPDKSKKTRIGKRILWLKEHMTKAASKSRQHYLGVSFIAKQNGLTDKQIRSAYGRGMNKQKKPPKDTLKLLLEFPAPIQVAEKQFKAEILKSNRRESDTLWKYAQALKNHQIRKK